MIVTAIIIIISSLIGTVLFLSKNEAPKEDVIYEDENIKKADYIFLANEKGEIDLYSTKEEGIINSTKLEGDNFLFSKDNSLEKVVAYNGNSFFEVKENEGNIETNKLIDYKAKDKVNSFKFSRDYIVVCLKESVDIINLSSKSVNSFKVSNISSYTVFNNKLAYSVDDYIYLKNLEDNSDSTKIEIGDKTKGLFVLKDKIVAFNNFGSKKNKNIIVYINSENLYIEHLEQHSNSNLYPILNDDDDSSVKFIEDIDKEGLKVSSFYEIIVDEGKEAIKNKVPLLDRDNDFMYDEYNTVSTKGYIYTNMDNKLTIFDLRAEGVDSIINTEKTFFMPILK